MMEIHNSISNSIVMDQYTIVHFKNALQTLKITYKRSKTQGNVDKMIELYE